MQWSLSHPNSRSTPRVVPSCGVASAAPSTQNLVRYRSLISLFLFYVVIFHLSLLFLVVSLFVLATRGVWNWFHWWPRDVGTVPLHTACTTSLVEDTLTLFMDKMYQIQTIYIYISVKCFLKCLKLCFTQESQVFNYCCITYRGYMYWKKVFLRKTQFRIGTFCSLNTVDLRESVRPQNEKRDRAVRLCKARTVAICSRHCACALQTTWLRSLYMICTYKLYNYYY